MLRGAGNKHPGRAFENNLMRKSIALEKILLIEKNAYSTRKTILGRRVAILVARSPVLFENRYFTRRLRKCRRGKPLSEKMRITSSNHLSAEIADRQISKLRTHLPIEIGRERTTRK